MKNQNRECVKIFDLDLESPVHSLEFHTEVYMLFAATDDGVKFVNLKSQAVEKSIQIKLYDEEKELKSKSCHALALDASGHTIYTGWSDGFLRVYDFI
jgi:WD40 repeat protein